MTIRLTAPQRRALEECADAGYLWCTPQNLWRYMRTLDNGMIYQVAGSPTIYTLIDKGMLKRTDTHTVQLTDKGARALTTTPKAGE